MSEAKLYRDGKEIASGEYKPMRTAFYDASVRGGFKSIELKAENGKGKPLSEFAKVPPGKAKAKAEARKSSSKG